MQRIARGLRPQERRSFSPAESQPDRHTRTIAVADEGEAELLTVAFNRFVELHGRVLCDPQCRCALHRGRGEMGEGRTLLATLWSERAAGEFDRFWDSYRRVYGPEHAWDLAPVA